MTQCRVPYSQLPRHRSETGPAADIGPVGIGFAGGTFNHADVEAGVGVAACGGGGGCGGSVAPCTGVAHCGQTAESSGMEAPHLKQNIDTSLAFYVVHGTGGTVPQGGKYFIAIEKTITCARREPLSLVTGV